MTKDVQEILMEKLNNIDMKVNDFSEFARANFKSINSDISELKATTKSTEKQATLTNSRVNKLEDKVVDVKEYRATCPGVALEEKLRFALFFRQNYKILIPGFGIFTGAVVAAYSVITYLIEKLM